MVVLLPKLKPETPKNLSERKASRGEIVALLGTVLCTALALGILVGRLLGVLDA